jgi:hypothetical protein
MPAPRVNFIGLGAQKCASTWVYQVLAEHPQSALSTPKELDYFSYFWGRGHDWYERHFSPGPQARVVGDNSPSYFFHPLAPARAARYNPELRIVLALRDPVERAFSNHLHMVREGFLQGPDLSFEYGLSRNETYLEQSRYATHLRRWLERFPRERIHVLLREEVALAGAEAAGRLYRFLGLDEDFLPSAPDRRANVSEVARRPGADRLLRGAARAVRRLGLGAAVRAVKAGAAGQRLYDMTRQDLRDVVPPMRPETATWLRTLLRPEVEDLARLLDRRSLPWPGFGAPGAAAAQAPQTAQAPS